MFDELVKQVQRLFSSKKNGAKQVAKLTDQLHYQKLVLIALAIVLLLGYSKLREDFVCQGVGVVSPKVTTRFCLINGTTTTVPAGGPGDGFAAAERPAGAGKRAHNLSAVVGQRASQAQAQAAARAPSSSSLSQAHIGFGFVSPQTRVINHNYMRSQWALLILLALCSYFAQRNWSSLFKSDVLRALLRLQGAEELRLVRAAESARPYEMLSSLGSDLDKELEERIRGAPDSARMPRNERVARTIDLVDSHVNIYDHKLDYYPNQLTYLLLTKNTASYKLSCLKLRRELILNALLSTLYTLAQFLLPLVFISNEYLLFGWRYLVAIVSYLSKFITSNEALDINSIDYELSGRIFPISTQCEYKQTGVSGNVEKFTVQCTVAINEIGSKLFVVIWWYVVASLLVELYSLLTTLLCSVSRKTLALTYGWRYWPQARKQADLIASFRYVRAHMIGAHEIANRLRADKETAPTAPANGWAQHQMKPRRKAVVAIQHPREQQLQERDSMAGTEGVARWLSKQRDDQHESERIERKRLEAEGPASACEEAPKVWYNYCPRDLCRGAMGLGRWLICCKAAQRRRRIEREAERDMNIYYLLYLLYLREGKSQSRVEEIIKMTARALTNYLDDLESSQRERELQPPDSRATADTAAQQVASSLGAPEEPQGPEPPRALAGEGDEGTKFATVCNLV